MIKSFFYICTFVWIYSFLETMPFSEGALNFYLFGERGSHTEHLRKTSHIQNYQEVQKNLMSNKKLFEDPEFQPNQNLLPSSIRRKVVKWLRPTEIFATPQFEVAGYSRFDLQQGAVGNCWMVAAAASLTLNDDRFHIVVPMHQSFNTPNYTGCFRFRLWNFGSWVEVIVDDRLPCDRYNKLLFMSSSIRHEVWPALLEKAYAKLHNGYGKLDGGHASNALVTLTGGISERLDIVNMTNLALWNTLVQGTSCNALITANIENHDVELESVLRNGLVVGHVYTLTGHTEVTWRGKKVILLRLRNPWGKQEWSGAWSDKSNFWKELKKDDIERVGYNKREDGEFWMTFQDFASNFHELELTLIQEISSFRLRVIHSEWITSVNAGGSRIYGSFWKNPTFLLYVPSQQLVVIALMQDARRARNEREFAIGFDVIPIPSKMVRNDVIHDITSLPSRHESYSLGDFKLSKEINTISTVYSIQHSHQNEVIFRTTLDAGLYAIIPSTWYARRNRKFLLRILQPQ